MSIKLFKNLLMKSCRLQIEIEQEQKKAVPDGFRLLRLKKTRLFIKDRLMTLAKKANPSSELVAIKNLRSS